MSHCKLREKQRLLIWGYLDRKAKSVQNNVWANGENRKSEMRLRVICYGGFPGGAVVENLPANAGDTGSSPGLGRSQMPRSG